MSRLTFLSLIGALLVGCGTGPEPDISRAARSKAREPAPESTEVEGEFIVEVGQERIRLNPGDSLLAPRQVPHVWAYVGDTRGRMLIAFMPAGKIQAICNFTEEV